MGSTENEHQRKLQRVKTILGTSRSRMQSRKVVRSVASRYQLVRLLSLRVRIATAVFLVLASTINSIIAAIANLQITFAVRRSPRRYNLLHCQCLQPSTSVPLVTSRWSAESPVLMTSLIHNDRFWQLNPRISPPCSHCLQLRVPRSFSTGSTLPFSAKKILHVSGTL